MLYLESYCYTVLSVNCTKVYLYVIYKYNKKVYLNSLSFSYLIKK